MDDFIAIILILKLAFHSQERTLSPTEIVENSFVIQFLNLREQVCRSDEVVILLLNFLKNYCYLMIHRVSIVISNLNSQFLFDKHNLLNHAKSQKMSNSFHQNICW